MSKELRQKIKLAIQKVNKVLQHITTDNITEVNELIHTGAKLVSEKLKGIPKRNENRSKKPWREMKIHKQIKKNLKGG